MQQTGGYDSELNKTDAAITEEPEGLTITGKPEELRGGVEADAWTIIVLL